MLSADECDAGAAGDWLCDKVVAVEVATRWVVPLANTYVCTVGAYGRRRQLPATAATPNLDLSRVYSTIAGRGRCRGHMNLYPLTTVGLFEKLGEEAERSRRRLDVKRRSRFCQRRSGAAVRPAFLLPAYCCRGGLKKNVSYMLERSIAEALDTVSVKHTRRCGAAATALPSTPTPRT